MKIDLHNHTLHSDGILTSEELCYRAKQNGVSIFALTDHDSVFGDEEIQECANHYGIRVIKGMELSTYYKGESIHVVCLFKDNVVPKSMVDFSYEIKEKRNTRARKMMENIRDIYGLKVDIEKMMSEAEVITRGNMLRNIMECNQMPQKEAAVYIQSDSKAYIPSTKLSVEDGLKIAREANCFVIFAHPCLVKHREYVEEILAYGFDAMEVRYPSEKNDEAYFTALAKKHKVLISAGSDCHTGAKEGDHGDIGTSTLNLEEFLPIAKAIHFEI